ncbi:MAG: MurR/RpiR family transcriptional regulator, partial [Lachnospiraceae bacterium]|nr:MurR/RpiR family transcriptional regulator [Lachnospiraceae bacterium]
LIMHDLLEKIAKITSSLPRAEKAIATALIENPEAIERMTLAEISRESGTSEASIVRFCKRLGYSGYTALKNDFIVKNHQKIDHVVAIENHDNMSIILEKLYTSNLEMLSETFANHENRYEDALLALLKAKSIHFFAVGDAYAVVRLPYIKFRRIGIYCTAEEDPVMQMITASNLSKDDVAIAVSYEGRSRNVVESMKIAKERGATTISITRRSKSPLLDYTDIRLLIAANDLTVGRDKITRRISDQFILEALYLGYVSKTEKDYSGHIRYTQQAIDKNKI